MRRLPVLLGLATALGWGLWRLGHPELVFGVSTDDHARILAAWAIRHGTLAPGDVWAPLPTLVTGLALMIAPFPHVVPGLVNLAWSALAVGVAARHARTAAGSVVTAATLALVPWFGWLANSALAEPPALAFLAMVATARPPTRSGAWPMVFAAALAGACRYEAWALVALLPLHLWRLPGSTGTLGAQLLTLLTFPLGWIVWHGVANGAPLGFVVDTLDTVREVDPDAPTLGRALLEIGDLLGPVAVLAALAAARLPPLLLAVEAAILVAQAFGATGVHTGARHHLPLLLAVALAAGAWADTLGRRVLAVPAALFVSLLPRVDTPPPAHSEAIEDVSRAAAALLERSAGRIVVDLPDDEGVAVRSLVGAPERTTLAAEDDAVRRWRASTNRSGVRVSPSLLVAQGDVAGLVTTAELAGNARVLARSGEYVLIGR